jgi:hypothetical protein
VGLAQVFSNVFFSHLYLYIVLLFIYSFSLLVLLPHSRLNLLNIVLLWVLFSKFSFHLLLPKIHRSESTLFGRIILGLPTLLIPSGLENINFLHGYDSSVLNRYTSQPDLLYYITFIIFGLSNNWYNSWLYLIHHSPLSLWGQHHQHLKEKF